MTTLNFRLSKNVSSDIVGDIIEANTGTRHDQKKYRIRRHESMDEDTDMLAVDFAPDIKDIQRSGTRGAGRGTMRGAR